MAAVPPSSIWLFSADVPDAGTLSILIVARDPLACAGLAALLSSIPGLAVVASHPLPPDLPAAIRSHTPDAAVWDQGFAVDPLDAIRALEESGIPTVALLPDELALKDAWEAGARAFLFRNTPPEQVLSAIFAVRQGLVAMDPEIASSLVPQDVEIPAAVPLTAREEDVITLMAEGLPNKTIADRLGVSENTVKYHVAAIMNKLGAQSRTEAVIRAARLGLLAI